VRIDAIIIDNTEITQMYIIDKDYLPFTTNPTIFLAFISV